MRAVTDTGVMVFNLQAGDRLEIGGDLVSVTLVHKSGRRASLQIRKSKNLPIRHIKTPDDVVDRSH